MATLQDSASHLGDAPIQGRPTDMKDRREQSRSSAGPSVKVEAPAEHHSDFANGSGIGKKKKKKKRKPKSQRGLVSYISFLPMCRSDCALLQNAATGFEDSFADAPPTPAEYEEERGLYDP